MVVVEEEAKEEDAATEMAAERDGSEEEEEGVVPEDTAPSLTRSEAEEAGSGTVHRTWRAEKLGYGTPDREL